MGILADPAQSGDTRELPLQDWTGVDEDSPLHGFIAKIPNRLEQFF